MKRSFYATQRLATLRAPVVTAATTAVEAAEKPATKSVPIPVTKQAEAQAITSRNKRSQLG